MTTSQRQDLDLGSLAPWSIYISTLSAAPLEFLLLGAHVCLPSHCAAVSHWQQRSLTERLTWSRVWQLSRVFPKGLERKSHAMPYKYQAAQSPGTERLCLLRECHV